MQLKTLLTKQTRNSKPLNAVPAAITKRLLTRHLLVNTPRSSTDFQLGSIDFEHSIVAI